MNKRSEQYMLSHDMDMCFMAHGILFHCATNGSLIPNALRDIPTFNSVKSVVINNMPFIEREELTYNEEHIHNVIRRQRAILEQFNAPQNVEGTLEETLSIQMPDEFIRENYIASFVEMAIRGAHSYDHASTERIDKDIVKESYILVAKPKMAIPQVPLILNHKDINIHIPDITDLVDLTNTTLTITVDYNK